MVAPVIIAAGVMAGAQVLSSVAQSYQSEKANKANQERLDQIRALFEAIKPPNYDVSILDPPEYIQQAIPEPAFDLSKLTPAQYAIAAKYVPEVAQYIGEKNPKLVELSATGQAGREAQVAALQQIKQRTGELADAEAESASGQAMRDAQIQSQSRSQSILQDASRRGQLGSGAMLAAQLQGSSDATARSADLSSNAYLEALRQKMSALRDSGQMGRQLAQDDMSQQSTNANIINDFNQRAAANQNKYLQYAANTRNEGQKYNVGVAQDVADRNVSEANKYDQMNRQRQDAMLEYLDKRRLGERNYQNQAAQATYDNRAGEIARQNNLKTAAYNNELQRANGIAGIGAQQINQTTQAARDRNQMYQSGADTVGSIAQAYGNYASQRDRDEAADKRYDREMKAKYGSSY